MEKDDISTFNLEIDNLFEKKRKLLRAYYTNIYG